MIRRAAKLTARLACALLPVQTRAWGYAMIAETSAIALPLSALLFAFGCLGGALREALRFHLLGPVENGMSAPVGSEPSTMSSSINLLDRPRRLAVLCAVAATGLGFAYMTGAGAPPRYLMMNGGALTLGLLILLSLTWMPRFDRVGSGLAGLALAAVLLLTGLLGVSADGATRWVSIGGLALQPSLFLLPSLALLFVRAHNGLALLAILIAALAVALQPDRAMAGALAAGMAALVLVRP